MLFFLSFNHRSPRRSNQLLWPIEDAGKMAYGLKVRGPITANVRSWTSG
ncbi:hypothetical protein X975_05762, partial [Stegodyphus mimosarum]